MNTCGRPIGDNPKPSTGGHQVEPSKDIKCVLAWDAIVGIDHGTSI